MKALQTLAATLALNAWTETILPGAVNSTFPDSTPSYTLNKERQNFKRDSKHAKRKNKNKQARASRRKNR